MRSICCIAALMFLNGISTPMKQGQNELPKTRAEQSNYEETSRYAEVMDFIGELQKQSPLLRCETFGYSQSGRALPLMILADPPVSTPQEAAASGKPVVFFMANIHAGEVEGKEAALQFARRVLTGDARHFLEKTILLIAPIYNADGNEKISVENRTEQNGPVGGVGVRENDQGLDLNRDYIKMDAPETQGLIRLFNRWDPHLTVDLHTTDGSYHGYHLTYSIPLNPTCDPRLIAYHREKMMPAIAGAMLKQHRYRTYYYGNFSERPPGGSRGSNRSGFGSRGNTAEGSRQTTTETRSWQAFSQQPRVGTNYVGFRNRLAILSEAYSYLDFRWRVEVTEAFIEEICRYVESHGEEIRLLTRRLDHETVRRGMSGPPLQVGVAYAMQPLSKPVEILSGEVKKVVNPRSGHEMTVMIEDRVTPIRMQDYGRFEATRRVPGAAVYFLPAEPEFRPAREKLLAQGITVEELTAPLNTEVETFIIESVRHAERPFQGHREARLTGHYEKKTVALPAGTLVIRAAQPLGTLAAYLLEPESEDGLTAWNVFDPALGPGKNHPVLKQMQAANMSCRIIENPNTLPAPPKQNGAARSASEGEPQHEE